MKCLIFDVDDTLIKYEKFNFEEWYRFIAEPVAREYGIKMNVHIWREMIEGKISRKYPEKFGIDAREFWKRVDNRNLEYRKMMLSEEKLEKYGDTDAIKDIQGIKIAWSSSSEECIRFVLEKTSLIGIFDFVVGKDYMNYEYIEEIKPKSGLLKEIIRKIECERCYVIGDSKKDMIAAKNAGCFAIFLSRNGRGNYGDIVIKSLRELKEIIG